MRAAFLRALRRSALAVVVGVFLALPLLALSGQAILVYYASFNETASSTGGGPEIYQALGGDAILEGPPAVFDVEFDVTGEGVAIAHGNPTAQPAYLDCRLDPSFSGSVANISMDLTRNLGPGDLVFRVSDDNDIGVIDLVFDDDGDIVVVVGAVALPLGLSPALLGSPLEIALELRDNPLGASTWELLVSGAGQSYAADGALTGSGLIRVSSMRFVRPAGEDSSDDVIDNVTLMTLNEVDSSQQGAIRK